MKKLLFIVALFFISSDSYPIIFWEPYPIIVTTSGVAGNQRVECAVFDSLLGNWQYYYTPYYNDSIDISESSSTVAVFYTAKPPNWTLMDTCYGFVIYDQELHQFKPILTYYGGYSNDQDFYFYVHGYNHQFYTYGECCFDQQTFHTYSWEWTWIYDILTHSWYKKGGLAGDGGVGRGSDWHQHFEVIGSANIYDPVLQTAVGEWIGHVGSFSVSADIAAFYPDGWSNGSWMDRQAVFMAFDAYTHSWDSMHNDNVLLGPSDIVKDQILLTLDDTSNKKFIAIYDDSLHQWSVRTDYHAMSHAIIKDRVVAFADTNSNPDLIFYQVFSPTLRSWVYDSSFTNGLDSLYIDEGTVTWIDSAGVTHIAGYIDGLGWGNYTTPLLLNFHLTDFYHETGYPLFYVRDYSIGSDSTWFSFGDGIETLPGAQHSLWHAIKINGHYPASGVDYNVCIYANTSAGIQSWCGIYPQPCSVNFSQGIGCAGNCEGQLIAAAVNGISPFTYVWSTGDSTSVLDSLCYGNYSVTVTDSSGCAVHHQFSFDTLTLSKVITPVTCNGLCDGEAIAFPSGGAFPYIYTWNSGDTTSDISSRCAGTYSVTVQDSNQCTVTGSFIIPQPSQFIPYNEIYSQPTCWDTLHGEIDIWCDAAGGTGPYSVTYVPSIGSFSSYHDTSFSIMNLPGGIYTITVSDANGCMVVFSDTLITPVPISNFIVTGINTSCFGSCDGSFISTIVGGTPPYNFYECGVGPIVPGTLCAGSYCIRVIDSSLCQSTDSIMVLSPSEILAAAFNTDPTCSGCSDGFIALNISGGAAPYNVTWNPSNGYFSGDTIHNLPAGIYSITILDTALCELIFTDTLTDPPASISDFTNEYGIVISPNPAQSQLVLQTAGSAGLTVGSSHPDSYRDAINTVEIWNLLGEKFLSIKNSDQIKREQMSIDVSTIPPGIYFIEVTTEKGTTVQKFTKQ